jgi:hypothetical protein
MDFYMDEGGTVRIKMKKLFSRVLEAITVWLFTPKCTCTRYEPEEDGLKEKPQSSTQGHRSQPMQMQEGNSREQGGHGEQ